MSDIDFIQPKKKVGEMINMSVLEDIKAEIWEYKKPLVVNGIHYVKQVDAVDIIEKYLEDKE